MSQQIIGVDIDGVLANFNEAYRRKLIEVTGRDLIPEIECSGNTVETTPPCWYYPTDHYGYTKTEDRAVWKEIIESCDFWETLKPYKETVDFLWALPDPEDAEVYFITTRAGRFVQLQSTLWLAKLGITDANVIIARGDKGPIARGIGLTHFIDDKPENCWNVFMQSPNTKVFMPLTRYNQHAANSAGLTPVTNIMEFIEELNAGN